MKRTQVALLYGGRSAEHEISVISALQLLEAADTLKHDFLLVYINQEGQWYAGNALMDRSLYRDPDKLAERCHRVALLPDPTVGGLVVLDGTSDEVTPVDVAFLAFHGQQGEDGAVQGLLELAGIPYTGCGVCSSAIAMHKGLCKQVAAQCGIPTLPHMTVHRQRAVDGITETVRQVRQHKGLGAFPLFVKPCCLGSSIGIGIATDEQSLATCLARVFRYDELALVEPALVKPLEINVSVLEGNPPEVSVVEVPVATGDALSYEDKYLRDGGKTGAGDGSGMAGLTRVIDPADLPASMKEQVRTYARDLFEALDCHGVVRFDFMVDSSTDALYFNELNPIPGSFAYYLWEKSTPPQLFPDLIDRLIDGALSRKARAQALETDLGLTALSR